MTEAEWLACGDPAEMLKAIFSESDASPFIPGAETGERKLRLLACGLARLLWGKIEVPSARSAVELGEQVADSLIKKKRQAIVKLLTIAQQSVPNGMTTAGNTTNAVGVAGACVEFRGYSAAWHAAKLASQTGLKKRGVAVVLREIFGNPFRPVNFSPAWRTDTTAALARQMYDTRDFSAMPILADALQDSGCENTDILNHCRGDGLHVRGCWVVDLVLEKE